MQGWMKISLILCLFGFLKEFRPSEPFIIPYLVGPWKNFTEAEVNQQIFPVGTYSYLAMLVVVFLVTDLLRYKPVIILEGISGIITWTLLIVGTNIASMQAVEFFYGVFLSTEVAYFAYIYTMVDRAHYQRVTSQTRAAFLIGRFLASVVGQALVSAGAMDYYQLNFLTVGGEVMATIVAIFLPTARRSIYFHAAHAPIVEAEIAKVGPTEEAGLEKAPPWHRLLWRDFTDAYTNTYVVKWSLWWALATCGYLQGYTYIQFLWERILTLDNSDGDNPSGYYNGAVEAVSTVLSAAAALGCGWLRLNWRLLGESTLALIALLEGAVLLISAYTDNIWLAYACYVVFGVLYYTMITIVNSEVASHINEDSYGLIFGVNTFFALVLQSALTAIVAAEGGLALPIQLQFTVYGSYFMALGLVFVVIAVLSVCRGKHRGQPVWLPAPTGAAEHLG